MRYSQCKCGQCQSWDSGMPPTPCFACPKCGSTLAGGPNDHKPVVPHDFEIHIVETDAGPSALSRCRWCMKTRKEVAGG